MNCVSKLFVIQAHGSHDTHFTGRNQIPWIKAEVKLLSIFEKYLFVCVCLHVCEHMCELQHMSHNTHVDTTKQLGSWFSLSAT